MNAKLVVFLAVIGVALAGRRLRVPIYDDYYPEDKLAYRGPKPYDFGYETKDGFGSTQNRQESSDGYGRVKGSYGYADPWGVFRQVDYVADEFGYRAKVRTNEPGTANQDPADVLVDADPVPGPVVYPAKKVLPVHRPYGPYKPY